MRFRTTLRGFARPRNWLVAVVPAAVLGGFLSLPAPSPAQDDKKADKEPRRSAPRRPSSTGSSGSRRSRPRTATGKRPAAHTRPR